MATLGGRTNTMNEKILSAIQCMVARSAIGASTVRSQGASGVAAAARTYLGSINLAHFSSAEPIAFHRVLDQETERLATSLPRAARSWGLARKCLNIFLREAFYNAFLQARYHLSAAEKLYELPLDGIVAKALRSRANGKLPPWPGVRNLKRNTSIEYQAVAEKLAAKEGVARIHLDAIYWAMERELPPNSTIERGACKSDARP